MRKVSVVITAKRIRCYSNHCHALAVVLRAERLGFKGFELTRDAIRTSNPKSLARYRRVAQAKHDADLAEYACLF